MSNFSSIFNNSILKIVVTSWLIAQVIKVIIGVIRERRFNFKWFVGTGGMPSAHTAGVSALSTSVGFRFGFDSIIFAITLVFSLITMFDAQGVRRSTGKQAEILNKMLDDIYWRKGIKDERLKEFLGHTPIEVIVGALLGIVVALLMQ